MARSPVSLKGREWHTLTVRMPVRLVKAMDDAIPAIGLTTRTEFVRQAIAEHVRRAMKEQP